MDEKRITLENQLGFPLYAASRAVIKKYNSQLEKVGLTYTQYITMMVLWERQTVNVKMLGESLFLDSGTLTPVLKKLEKVGLITRKRSASDERNLEVSVTEQSLKLRDKLKNLPTEIAYDTGLSTGELKVIYGLFGKILKSSLKFSEA